MNIIMSSFCFLSVQTVNFCGHIARYAPLSANILPSKQIQKSDSGKLLEPTLAYKHFVTSLSQQVRANQREAMESLW